MELDCYFYLNLFSQLLGFNFSVFLKIFLGELRAYSEQIVVFDALLSLSLYSLQSKIQLQTALFPLFHTVKFLQKYQILQNAIVWSV